MTDPADVRDLDDGTVVADGLFFPEGLRWRDGALWYSDVFGRTVNRVEPAGAGGWSASRAVATVSGMPSGLGWLLDDTLIVVSMTDRAVMAVSSSGQLELYADLRAVVEQLANDMVVDAHGRAYVGNYGFDVDAGAPVAPTRLVRVDPDGSIHRQEPELVFPNGMVFVDGEARMLVAETFADRVTSLVVAPDGALSEPSVVVNLPPGSGPDGIAVDLDERIWVPCAFGGRAVAVSADGQTQAEIRGAGWGVNCCAVGGSAGRTLFVAVAPVDEAVAASAPAGRIVAFDL